MGIAIPRHCPPTFYLPGAIGAIIIPCWGIMGIIMGWGAPYPGIIIPPPIMG